MKRVLQFAVDIEDDGMMTEELFQEAIERAGLNVLGVAWKATWTDEGYHKSEPPISSD